MDDEVDLHRTVRELRERIRRLEKTNSVLMQSAEGRAEAEDNAYDLFKANGTLEQLVDERTARLQRTQDALQRTLSLVRATLDSSLDGIIAIDLEENVVDSNQRFSELWRLDASLVRTASGGQLLGLLARQVVDRPGFIRRIQGLHRDDAFDREAAYRSRLQAGMAERTRSELSNAVLKGWPVGSEGFLASLAQLTDRRLAPLKRGRPRKVEMTVPN